MKENYEDYSSGRVLYGVSGATNFSVRIINEIFEWCTEYLGKKEPYTIYDPFCGSGYALTVLGFLYGQRIKEVFASDIDEKILEFAHKNLSLLTKDGIDNRITELKGFIQEYNKDSHKEALESAYRLKKIITESLPTKVFPFDIIGKAELPPEVSSIDFVFADVPYGELTEWKGNDRDSNPMQVFLNKVKGRLNEKSLIAIALNKKQPISHEGYKKVKTFSRGIRKIVILEVIF